MSKALTEAQKGYTAIEFESLAVAWAMEKFHHFLYISHFILETYQKPLEVILSKHINQAIPRLQRILIRTFSYHFTACYIPGLTNQHADYLSQLGGQKDTTKLPKLHLYQIANQLCTRSDSLHQLRLAMQEWWPCIAQTYYHPGLAKHHQRSTQCIATLLDIQRGTYCRG